MYKLSKKHPLMDKYIGVCDRLRTQNARVDVQQRKLDNLLVAVRNQKNRLRTAETKQRKLQRQQWDCHAGFLPGERR